MQVGVLMPLHLRNQSSWSGLIMAQGRALPGKPSILSESAIFVKDNNLKM